MPIAPFTGGKIGAFSQKFPNSSVFAVERTIDLIIFISLQFVE